MDAGDGREARLLYCHGKASYIHLSCLSVASTVGTIISNNSFEIFIVNMLVVLV